MISLNTSPIYNRVKNLRINLLIFSKHSRRRVGTNRRLRYHNFNYLTEARVASVRRKYFRQNFLNLPWIHFRA